MKPQTTAPAASNRWPAWIRYLLYFLIVAGFVKYLASSSGGPQVGTAAAPFELTNVLGGNHIRLSDYRGRPLLIEVFASWCSSCRAAAPMVAKLEQAHRTRVDFVGVSVDETAAQALATAQHWGIEFPVAVDDGSFSRSYQISAVPNFILVDERGIVIRALQGIPRAEALDAWLTELGRGR